MELERRAKREGVAAWFRRRYYGMALRVRSGIWWSRAVATAASFGLLAGPVLAKGLTWSIPYFAVWCLVGIYNAYNSLIPANMKPLQKNYLARKLRHYKAIRLMEQRDTMTANEVRQFQEEVLHLIASYTRDHCGDTAGTQVFANLLIEEGDHLRVVARDQAHREHSTTHRKQDTLAYQVFQTGEPQATGDVYVDFPNTPAGKPYNSILAIPVRFGDAIVGVVSVDSSRKYHFDPDPVILTTYLAPYVGLLGWTLGPAVATLALSPPPPGSVT
jgi:hypothetical protein